MDFTTIIALVKDYALAFKNWFLVFPPENQFVYSLLFLFITIVAISALDNRVNNQSYDDRDDNYLLRIRNYRYQITPLSNHPKGLFNG